MICHITPTIMDGIVVRWNPDSSSSGEISASRRGVQVSNYFMLRTERGRAEFDRTVALAWEMYRLLAKAAERGPFTRMEGANIEGWLTAHGVDVVDVHFGESLAEAIKRRAAT